MEDSEASELWGTEESEATEGSLLQLGTPLPTHLPTQLPMPLLPTQPLPTLLLPTPLPQRESFCFLIRQITLLS